MKLNKKVNLAIDGNEANVISKVGVNAYAFNMLTQFSKLSSENLFVTVYLKEKPNTNLPSETDFFKYKVLPGAGQWIIKKLSPTIWKERKNIDVFWTPSHYIPLLSPVPTACSIMDLGYLRFRKQFKTYDFWQLALWTSYSVIFSKLVFSISNSTKSEIQKHYPLFKNKVVTTLLGFDSDIKSEEISKSKINLVKSKYGIKGDYYLFMSTLKPSKNISGLLNAWSKFVNKHPKNTLVIAGKKGWLYDQIFKQVSELNLASSVIFTDFIEDQEKAPLIKGAKAFVLPSFWEGFGLDVLTAQSLQTPVIVSRVGSLPEVAGQAALYCDPENSDSIFNCLDELELSTEQKRKILTQSGLKNTKRFSWENTAKLSAAKLIEIAKK